MKTRKTRGLPAKLEAVRRRFDRWRKAHRPRSRIPDALWSVAVKMAGKRPAEHVLGGGVGWGLAAEMGSVSEPQAPEHEEA